LISDKSPEHSRNRKRVFTSCGEERRAKNEAELKLETRLELQRRMLRMMEDSIAQKRRTV